MSQIARLHFSDDGELLCRIEAPILVSDEGYLVEGPFGCEGQGTTPQGAVDALGRAIGEKLGPSKTGRVTGGDLRGVTFLNPKYFRIEEGSHA